MFDKTTIKILKFISKNQPCTFEKVGQFIHEDCAYSLHIHQIDVNHLIYKTGVTTTGEALISLTPEGEAAIEEYQRINSAELKSRIAIGISFVALFKPTNIDLIEFMKKLVRLLIE